MKLSVLKFGGTSLADDSSRQQVVMIIKEHLDSGCFPVVVVSAMGRSGDKYATDTLLNLLPKHSSNRHQAMITACGEIISATILAEELSALSIPAIALTGWQAGIYTQKDDYKNAKVISIDTCRIDQEIEKGNVPVICGFQGVSHSGDISTLGRGGSDTTAALIARALSADRLELYKDVPGVFSADPAKVKNAKLIKYLDYNEIAELSGNGAKIVHNPAIKQLADKKIPLYLGSFLSGELGTCIKPFDVSAPVTAVTSRSNLTLFSIVVPQSKPFSQYFSILAQNEISLDFITVNYCSIAFVVDKLSAQKVKNILFAHSWDFELKGELVKLTITGSGMTGQPGIFNKMISSLEKNNICIDMATDSYSTISCLIEEVNETKALNIIHAAFNLEV